MVVGVILAGGYGKRLRPITEDMPKPLVEIKDNFTILDKQILDLKYSGIDEVYLLVGYMWEKIRERYGERWKNVNINYLVEEKPQGTLLALKSCFENIDDDSVVLNGDVVSDLNIREMIRVGKNSHYLITIAITKMRSPYGIVEFRGSRAVSFREKPLLDYYINAGLYYIKVEGYEYFRMKYPERAVEKTVFPYLAEREMVGVYNEDVFWQSVDSLKDLENVRREFENRIYKPWGYEKIVVSNEKYLVKELFIKKGFETSHHYHEEKDETMHVQEGSGFIVINDVKKPINRGEIFRIKPRTPHKIIAKENLILYEYSTPHPEDTVRIEDIYERD